MLDPLEMGHTYTSLPAARADGLVRGRNTWFGVDVPAGTAPFPGALPDGYLISTATDLPGSSTSRSMVRSTDGG